MSIELTEENQKKDENENKRLHIILVIAAVIIVALIAVIIFMISSKTSDVGTNTLQESEKRPVVVLEENAEEMAEQIFNQTEPAGIPLHYQVTMNSTWEFENGKAESRNAYVENSEDNETDVYFDIVRNDTQETIYQSPVIPLGQKLEHVVLDKELEAGNYECTLTYHLIDEEQNTLTTVNMWLMIKIEN